METLAFVSGCLGIVLSLIGLGGFAVREHRIEKRRTVSEMATRDKRTLLEFRIILWVCGSLISVMMYGLVLPSLEEGSWLAVAYTLIFGCELALSLIPAQGNRAGRIHNFLAFSMAAGMLGLVVGFIFALSGPAVILEWLVLGTMLVLGGLALKFWDHFLYFELPFIFMSHISILIAGISALK